MRTNTMPGLPDSVKSRFITVNDLNMHILEAYPPNADPSSKPPLLVLLHGFPELAYSWRKVIEPLTKAGYAVVAPDQRGYGQTREQTRKEGKITYEEDLAPFRMLNLATDILALVYALGYTSVEAVVGHDFGSPVAAHCALIRPDVFKSVVLMSAPYTGPPALSSAFDDPNAKSLAQQANEWLARLDPPRKHYTMYFSTPEADKELRNPPEGLHVFLRTYYRVKSADWAPNQSAGPLAALSPEALSVLPHYYIMPLTQSMPESIASYAATASQMVKNTWLPDAELAFYVDQFAQTGFQGGLNWYRCQTDGLRWSKDLRVFAGRKIEVPAMFLAGKQDWGVFQIPGAVDKMKAVCTRIGEEGFVLVDGAGHWVQQEKPEEVVRNLLSFLEKNK
ncbi:unnamed protein product [Cyclocybe aegerita]|uniref:AB hydrolase-1 domain-containing protein n=1 Tax=Cyclocybe aegerita TaxID=1973307 RepID=A0A8S0VVQ8_CYCAE|nr:unnamed protein product [Cyclocybe aegerita]